MKRMKRAKFTVTVDPQIMQQIDDLVRRTRIYRNRSHAVEVSLMQLLERVSQPRGYRHHEDEDWDVRV